MQHDPGEHKHVHGEHGEGKTLVDVLVDDEPVGAIALADIIREESREALRDLEERLGVQVMMLTGDAEPVAKWVARELSLDEYFAEVLPDQKAEKIEEVQGRGLTVAMVGDGVNDAPALTQADVGIAIGAGTDVAIESASIVLVRSDPRDVTAIVSLAKKTYSKMVQNLWWATGYNAVTIPLAAGVLAPLGIILPPAVGAVVMSFPTVICGNQRAAARDAEARGRSLARRSRRSHPLHGLFFDAVDRITQATRVSDAWQLSCLQWHISGPPRVDAGRVPR
jgi:Cu2+-exporting ATPase